MMIEQAEPLDNQADGTNPRDVADGNLLRGCVSQLGATQIRRGEPVTAAIWVGDAAPRGWQVWQISGEGIELREPDRERSRASSVATPDQLLSIASDTRVGIRLQVGPQKIETAAYVLSADQTCGGRRVIRLRWMQRPWEELDPPWPCSRRLIPWGTADHPAIFGRRLVFTVEAIGRQALHASLDASEELVFPGLVLPATVSFPAVGNVVCELEVHAIRAHPDHQDRMQAILAFNNPSRELSESVGQYLLQSGPWVTSRTLRRAGYRPTSIAQACSIRTADTSTERLEAVALRTEAYADYVAAGVLSAEDATGALIDEFDARARILIARHKGQIIGSLRLVYHDAHDQFEHERYTQLPSDLDRERTIEITRVCTHPDFRGGDLLMTMFKVAMLKVLESGRYVVLGSAEENMLSLYERIGMRRVGRPYRRGGVSGPEHCLITGDARKVISGRGVGPLPWNILWDDVWAHATSGQTIQPRGDERARVAAYRMLRPLSGVVQRRHARHRQQQRS
jgi:predicted GNAT family N-acyltransferase